MRVLALDLAAKTGWCIGDVGDRPPRFGTAVFSRTMEGSDLLDTAQQAARALEWLLDFLKLEQPDRVAIEAPVPERALGEQTNAWATALKFELLGVIGAVCVMKSIPMRFHNIQAVRKHFIGHGNIAGKFAKPETMRICKAAGWDPKNADEADAGAVWHLECTRIAPQEVQVISPIFLGIAPFQRPERGERVSLAPKSFRRAG